MGTVEPRTTQEGQIVFRAKIRLNGFPSESATFTRKTDARKWIQDTESAIRDGRYFPRAESKRHTLADAIDRYVKTILPTKPKSQAKQTQQLEWWKKRIGAYTVADITPALIAECKDELLNTQTRRKKNYTPASVNRYLAAISHVFTIAVKEWGWANDNPLMKIRKPPESAGRTRYLDDQERQSLLNACKASKNPYLFLAVVLSLSTGARQMEIWGLRWKQVDCRNGVIRLTNTETKNRESRTLPLRGLALELMKEHEKIRNLKNSEFIFPGPVPGRPMDFRTPWDAALTKAEIKDFTYHDLRHSCASYLAMNGASLLEIADVLGHKTLHMVKRYAHLSDNHKGEVVASMNDKIFGKQQAT